MFNDLLDSVLSPSRKIRETSLEIRLEILHIQHMKFAYLIRMAFGNDGGMVVVDIIQKSVLLSMASSDLYSSADPYTRLPRSPKRQDGAFNDTSEQCRSPSTDQVSLWFLVSFLFYVAHLVNE